MMLDFLETGKALYVLAAICGLGLAVRLVARNLYKRLIKETDNMTLTKNRYLRELKQKTENTYRLNQGINNSRVYLEKQLASYRFLGVGLSGWGAMGGQMTILCFLLGAAASFGAYWYRCDSYYIVLYGSVGIMAGLVTMAADYWANLQERKQQLLNSLQDYMENSLFNRLMRETAQTAEEPKRAEQRESVRIMDRRSRTERMVREGGNREETDMESRRTGPEPAEKKARDESDDDLQAQDLESLGRSSRLAKRRAGEERKEPEPGQGRRDVDYLKNSLDQIAASRERSRTDGEWFRDLSQDELEIVGQILKQYLG